MRRTAAVLVLSLACLGAAAAPRDWRPVPGADDLELDAASAQHQGSTVTAWVRSLNATRALDGLLRDARDLPKHRRTVVLAQADCRARQVRSMALVAYGAGGAPVWSSSLPGRALAPDAAEPLAWLYDSLCELGRAAAAN